MTEAHAHAFSSNLLENISKLLQPSDLKILKELKITPETDENSRLAHFLNHLFARAPQEIVNGKDAQALADITHGCLQALRGMRENKNHLAVSLEKGANAISLFAALDDGPFIVSSIAERLSEAGIRVNAFLHPILAMPEGPVALSYIDISFLPVEAEATLLPSLIETLLLLKQVVADFGKMITEIRQFSSEITSGSLHSNIGPVDDGEIREFLTWLTDNTFFLLGTARFEKGQGTPVGGLGLWNLQGPYRDRIGGEIEEDLARLDAENLSLLLTKLRSSSAVHRPATLLDILVRLPSGTVLSISGYLTSKAWAREAQDIPILRQKVTRILEEEEAIPNSHDYKYMVEVIDHMPTDDALCGSITYLRSVIHLALGVFSREVSRSLTHVDQHNRQASTVIVLPPERYSASIRSILQALIEEAIGAPAGSSSVHLDSSKRRQLRLYFDTPLPLSKEPDAITLETLERRLVQETLPWEDRVAEGTHHRDITARVIKQMFPPDYKAAVATDDALRDIAILRSLSADDPVQVALNPRNSTEDRHVLTVFSLRTEPSISQVIPVLENVWLEVLGAHSYLCHTTLGSVHLLKLALRPYGLATLDTDQFNTFVAPGLATVIRGEAQNDLLNSLMRSVSLSIKQVGLLRALCALLWQAGKLSTRRMMWEALATAPLVARRLCDLFEEKFDPGRNYTPAERENKIASADAALLEELRSVMDINHDRVLKALLSLVRGTVRTNYYSNPDALALKIRSELVEIMPQPRPLFEIFVYSNRIEGTHLRSARVARGGIRWSDRIDDFRSEVLGLMKTQKIKNVIIVPSGAKGGFIVKNLPKESEAIPAAVEGGYKEYIRALLSLTDNKKGDLTVHPSGLIIHDELDPYFVVAADKGTATFSDVANSIATKEFDFWLGDAFASGGSSGYDHKRYGITARGGWECVQRHFRDLGIQYQDTPFTVIGIGDMSGDVFGNGLLLSRSMALVAAFNHKHIFIDPKPSVESGYEERSRLFKLPRSQWTDYNRALISTGGGVFNRFDKEITLSPEIRTALGIGTETPATVDGETLISLILKAPVDLLWNGGIGTYVKSSSESHSDVNDGTNDRVRVNAGELRVRVVGEGGNLGFTQRARIEFSLAGGRINTDAIDNSGGVDLSDHEVNLKLLFSPLITSGKLSVEDRNTVLRSIDTSVVTSVLGHNADQALMLTVSENQSRYTVDPYRYLIRDMHKLGFLDRNRDGLPDDAELDDRTAEKLGLFRPELAICSAAVKMWVKEKIQDSSLCEDSNLEPFLLRYFPSDVVSRFRDGVLGHSLRKEIIASEVVNSLLPCVGISFIHSAAIAHDCSPVDVMKCLLAADRILCADELRARLRTLDSVENCANFMHLWSDLGSALQRATGWLLTFHGRDSSLGDMVKLYSDGFDVLIDHSESVFAGRETARHQRRVDQYLELKTSRSDAIILSLYRRVVPALEVLWTAREFNQRVEAVAIVFSQVLDELGINTLFKYEAVVDASNKWEQQLVSASFQEIRRSVSTITGQLMTQQVSDEEGIRQSLRSSNSFEAIRATMGELEELGKQNRPFPMAVLPVVAQQLRLFQVPSR